MYLLLWMRVKEEWSQQFCLGERREVVVIQTYFVAMLRYEDIRSVIPSYLPLLRVYEDMNSVIAYESNEFRAVICE